MAAVHSFSDLKNIWHIAAQGTKYDTDKWATIMAAIALAESSGRDNATNPTDNGGTQTSWGLWQISLGNHTPPDPNWADPFTNARLAIGKLNSQGLRAWGTYTSGAYLRFMPGGSSAGVPSGPGGGGGTPSAGGSTGGSSATTTSDTTTTNPVQFKTGTVPGMGWAGSFISAVTGAVTGDSQIAAQGISQSGGLLGIATGVAGLTQTLSKATQLFLLLFRPQFWLRIGAAITGFIALGGAFYFMGKAV